MDKKDLISRGYFPKELPPPFNTTSLANFVVSPQFTFPKDFRKIAKLYSYNHIRYGSLRRNLNIPNPLFFVELCELINSSWLEIQNIIQSSIFSKSKPIHTPLPQRERSISPVLDFYLVPVERAKNRIAGRYLLQTDISRFYQSIYTHSVPWALHGKSFAKQHKQNMNYLGNKLDKILRNSQDGQTLGIPIGPDTSLVIAELILCTTDIELETRLKSTCNYPFKGFRYSDDYEFVFQNLSDAESALSQIQQVLAEFELSINPDKTKIIELPSSLDSIWVLELSDYRFSSNKLVQMQDIIRYFDKAFQLRNDFPGEPVLKYAVSRISNFSELNSSNWPLLESLLLQTIAIEPSTLRDSLSIIQEKQNQKWDVNLSSLQEVINFQITRNAILGHSSEVAWSIWAAMVFKIPISQQAAEAISKMEDSVVAISALNARDVGQINKGLDTSKWEQYLTVDSLYSEQWLLAYEANIKGYLHTGRDYVSQDSWFSQLKNSGVSFYNNQTQLVIPPNTTSGPSGHI